MALLNDLRVRAGVRTLLSAENSNPKVRKNLKLNVSTAALHLAPGDMSGHEVCPKRSPGCSAACLHYAGNPAYLTTKTTSRIKKTKLFFSDRNLFMNILALELAKHILKAKGTPAARLNATSDIVWEKKKFILWEETKAELKKYGIDFNPLATDIISLFTSRKNPIIYYDYTSIPNRNPPPHYHLTFSMKEQNMNDTQNAITQGLNVAVVFPDANLPETFLGLPVIDGDETDYRPADPTPCIVGLKAKGVKGRADQTGFIFREPPPTPTPMNFISGSF